MELEESVKIIGCQEHAELGFEAQLKSVVMFKNKNNVLPLQKKIKVYSPDRYTAKRTNFIKFEDEERQSKSTISSEYFEQVNMSEDADIEIVFVVNPLVNNGFEMDELREGKSVIVQLVFNIVLNTVLIQKNSLFFK